MIRLRKQLIEYITDNEEELNYKTSMLKLISKEGELAFSRKSEAAHFTASAWLIDQSEKKILLIKHNKLNKWLQPGGHADGQQELEEVARKEAFEETNLNKLKPFVEGIFDIDIHFIPEHKNIKAHYHYDVRFAYWVDNVDETQINNESKAFKWLSENEVINLTDNTSILRMLRKTKDIFDRK
jgi:8-oxo-dGTP pyrophosphatase MutT (NUDIX family)